MRKKAKKTRSISVLTILEMFFSLLMIPCGFAFTEVLSENVADDQLAFLMLLEFFLLALVTFLRAKEKRYRTQARERRLVDFIFSGASPGS